MSLKIILKISHQLQLPDNSNYASISKNGREILVVGDSHVKRIRRINFNKNLRNGKAYFSSFSGTTRKQPDHYIIPYIVDDKPDVVTIHVGANDISYNASYKISLKISSRLVQIVKVTVLTMSLFRQFYLKKIQR